MFSLYVNSISNTIIPKFFFHTNLCMFTNVFLGSLKGTTCYIFARSVFTYIIHRIVDHPKKKSLKAYKSTSHKNTAQIQNNECFRRKHNNDRWKHLIGNFTKRQIALTFKHTTPFMYRSVLQNS